MPSSPPVSVPGDRDRARAQRLVDDVGGGRRRGAGPAESAPSRAFSVWPPIAVVGFAIFAAAAFIAGVCDNGYNPLSDDIGALGAQNAPDPDLMKAGFLALAVAPVAAGATLMRARPGKLGAAASVIVILAGLGETAVAFVRQDCSTARSQAPR